MEVAREILGNNLFTFTVLICGVIWFATTLRGCVRGIDEMRKQNEKDHAGISTKIDTIDARVDRLGEKAIEALASADAAHERLTQNGFRSR